MSNILNLKTARALLVWSRRLPLGVQLTALVLMAVLIPLAVYLAVALPMTVRSLVDSDARRLEIQSSHAVGELERFVSHRDSAIRSLSQADVLEGNEWEAIDQYFGEILNTESELQGILLTDISGQPVARAGDFDTNEIQSSLKKQALSKLIAACAAASQGDIFFSDPIDTESGPAILQATPVTDDTNKVVIKVLLCRVSLARPTQIANEFTERFEGDTLVYILDTQGQIICSSDISAGFQQPFTSLCDLRDFERVSLRPDASGEIEYRNSSGADVAAGFSNTSSFGKDKSLAWTLIAVTPVSAIARPVRETASRLFAIGVTLALVSVLFAFLLTRRITRPLKEVANAAKCFSLGADEQRLPIGSAEEISEISTAFNAMAKSIEQRKRALIESESRYRSLVELLPVGVQRCDINGQITFVNRAHADIFGWTVGELEGKHIWDFEIDESSRLRLQRYYRKVVNEQPDPAVHLGRNRTSDGRVIDIRVDWTYEKDSSGKLTSLISVLSDITEPLRIEREVRAMNEELQLAHRQAKLGSWKLNTTTGSGQWSPELFRIFERDVSLGPPDFDEFIELIHPDDRKAVAESHQLLIENRPEPRTQFRIVATDGSTRHLQGVYCGDVIRDADGQSFLIGTLQDITELKLAEQRLRENEEELRLLNSELENRVLSRTRELGRVNDDLEAYAHSVAHDLRAPLRAMYGFSRALREDYGEELDDTGREYTGFIEEASHQMDQLISDLLEYSKVGRKDLSIDVHDLNEIASLAIVQLSAEISQSGAVMSIQPSMGTITGHRRTLVQILMNLVSNALKFTEKGAEPNIRIYCERLAGDVRVWVEDNGIGIRPDFHEKIFKVFERLHGVESYPGTGIGLAIVRRAIESMGGRFGVESAPGQGSRFWVEIPNCE